MTDTIAIPGYRVLRKLGHGGTATVYLAIQESFGREVALKVMSPLLNSDPSFHTRFMREARIVAQMHHASIVPVFDVGEHQSHHYLSMEYLPGGDLRQRVVEGRCSAALALDVCMAVSSALELAHRKGFVHRDIKPQNILFREDGTPVLTDFGIARAVDVGTSLTAVGMLVGTPSYMSPEQVKGLELDGRTDLYSLGIVFFEMLTGAVPFRADSDSALSVALKHLSETLPPLPPEYAHFQSLMDRLAAKDREQRFASATEVIQAIRRISESPGARLHTLIRPQHTQPQLQATATATRVSDASVKPQRAAKPAWLPWAAATIVAAAVVGTTLYLNRPAPATVAESVKPALSTAPAMAVNASPSLTPDLAASTAPSSTLPAAALPAATAPQPQNVAATTVVPQTPAPRSVADTTPTLREPDPAQRIARQIGTLLAQAEQDIAAGALVQPASANAAERYRAILALQPNHPEAVAGLQGVADRVIADAQRARTAQEVDTALLLVAQVASIQPEHPRLARVQSELQQRKASFDERDQVRSERARRHLAKLEEYLARTPMTLRAAAAAHDHFDEAYVQSPRSPAMAVLKDRVIATYVAAAEYEVGRNEPERALKTVAYARKRNLGGEGLDRIEATAQQRVATR